MFELSFLALLVLGLQDVCAAPTPHQNLETGLDFTPRKREAFAPATELKTSDKVVTLKHTSAGSKSSEGQWNLFYMPSCGLKPSLSDTNDCHSSKRSARK